MNQVMFPQDVVDFFAEKSEKEVIDLQKKMAGRLADAVRDLGDMSEVDEMSILDALGTCGLSLIMGNIASKSFISGLAQVPDNKVQTFADRFIARHRNDN